MRQTIQSCNNGVSGLPASQQMRHNKALLEKLVRRVIRNELNDRDRLLVRLHWYQGKSKDEIAALLGVDRSTVHRGLERAGKIIYDNLKYAVDYHFDASCREEAKETLRNAGQSTFAIEALSGIGERLYWCRRQKRLSLQELSQITGIAPERLQTLEANGREMMMTELGLLTAALGVSATDLIFGEGGKEYVH